MFLGRQLCIDVLNGLKANTTGAFDDATLALLQGSVPTNPAAALGDFTVATFSGYAPATVADTDYVGPSVSGNGNSFFVSDDKVFEADDPLTVTNTITGWLLHDGTNPLAWAPLDTPIPVNTPGQLLLARGGCALGVTVESIGDVVTP